MSNEYNLFEFQKDLVQALKRVNSQNKIPVFCGGSGLYIDAVLRRYKLTDVATNDKLRKKLEKLSDKELIALLKQYGQLHNITDTTDRERTIRAIEIAEQQNKPDDPEIDIHNIKYLIEDKKVKNLETCPNCGADIKISMAGICEYCGSKITSGNFDWILSSIEQDEAYQG